VHAQAAAAREAAEAGRGDGGDDVGGHREQQFVVVARGRRGEAGGAGLARMGAIGGGERYRGEVEDDGEAARLGHARGVDQQAVADVHHRMREAAEHAPLGEARGRAAIACGEFGGTLRTACDGEAGAGIADRPGDPERVILAGAATRGGGRVAAEGGDGEDARGARGQAHGVAAEQCGAAGREHLGEAGQERAVPGVVGQRIVEQEAVGLRALAGDVRKVGRDELPRDVLRRVVGQEVDALDQRVGGDDEGRMDQPGGIVAQTPRCRMERQGAQGGQKFGFGHADGEGDGMQTVQILHRHTGARP